MWKKIQVYKTPISQYAHEGFILEYKRHRITNLVKNYSVSLPFKLFPVINLYSYELMFTNNYLILNMVVNLDELHYKLDNYIKSGSKDGMVLMDDSLMGLFQKGIISDNNLIRYAINITQMEENMGSIRKQPNI